jgi:peroxiredoxin
MVLFIAWVSGVMASGTTTQAGGKEVAIRVVGTDGKGAGHVLVVLVPAGRTLDLYGRHEVDDDPSYVRKETDGEGMVRLMLPAGPSAVVAVDDRGYARMSAGEIRKEGVMHLEAWGKVEGEFRIGEKPGVGVELMVRVADGAIEAGTPGVRVHGMKSNQRGNIETDKEGQFTIDPVPPGEVCVDRHLMWEETYVDAGARDRDRLVGVKAGETTKVRFGGEGRRVVGKFVVPASMGEGVEVGFGRAVHEGVPAAVPMPGEVAKESMEKQQAWYGEFIASQAGREYLAKKVRAEMKDWQYKVEIGKDGSFVAEDVEPGHYTLTAGAWKKRGDGKMYDQVGEVAEGVNVPAGGKGEVDVGAIEMKPPRRDLMAGDVAPDFVLRTLDGEEVRLEKFRGKYVLVCFWATWCGPCVGELPGLKKLYEETRNDPRFVMMSISMDDDPFIPKKYVVEHGDDWMQLFGGREEESKVYKDYNGGGLPMVMLVGPGGKIVATGLREEGIAGAVKKALGK